MQESATPTPPHNPGPSHMRTRGNRSHTATNILDPNCTRARGCHSHASTQSGPLSHVHKRPQFPRHNPTFWAPTVRMQEGATPTPPHNPGPSHMRTRGNRSHTATNILDPNCTRARGCHSHASTQSGPLSHVHKRPQFPRQNPTFWAPAAHVQEGATPTPPHNPGPSHTCTRGHSSHAAPTPQVHILGPYCTHVRGCHSHASTQSGPLSHAHKRKPLPHCHPTYWTPSAHVQEGATPTPPHNPGPSHTCTRGHSSHAAPTPQVHILGPYCTHARGCHSHASTQSGLLSHAHKRKPLPHRHQHTGPQLHTCKRVPLPRLHTIRAPLTRTQEDTSPTLSHTLDYKEHYYRNALTHTTETLSHTPLKKKVF
ncbi:inactive histone-lysine N-methyltransferase 2E-like isoform X1 [Oreochromis niloticus]|uniref:inactive histone-lysine N-methyltransferase 2E-like isoform X1 n=1 Tax=Oreochromis niloticus TaxID=8128 RepID=UPI000DF2DBAD|nr:inactive histone-lysine N-methyltransferase 2E-like isoform X1 [Oreochromis niloticus]